MFEIVQYHTQLKYNLENRLPEYTKRGKRNVNEFIEKRFFSTYNYWKDCTWIDSKCCSLFTHCAPCSCSCSRWLFDDWHHEKWAFWILCNPTPTGNCIRCFQYVYRLAEWKRTPKLKSHTVTTHIPADDEPHCRRRHCHSYQAHTATSK